MTRGNSSRLVEEDPKIKQPLLRRLRIIVLRKTELLELSVEIEQLEAMALPQRSISNCARPILDGVNLSIVWPPIATNNFELKLNFIQMVQ